MNRTLAFAASAYAAEIPVRILSWTPDLGPLAKV